MFGYQQQRAPASVQRKSTASSGDGAAAPIDVGQVGVGGPSLQALMAAGGNQGMVQLRGDRDPGAVHAEAARGVRGSGGPLPHQAQIQRAFGAHDVSGVQAHVGGAAAQASEAMGAEAYATGDQVAFKSAPSLHTAAHEAAHVVQQRGGVALKGGVGQVGDAYERHADQVADAVVQGKSAEGLLDSYAGGRSGGERVQQRAVQHEKKDPKVEAQEMESQDQGQNARAGHALDRHGPEVSENALKRRLVTGYAPDGAFVPAPGYSTKFNAYADYVATRKAATARLTQQAKTVLKDLKAELAAYASACTAFDNEPPGAGRAAKSAARAAAATHLQQTVANRYAVGPVTQSVISVAFQADHANPLRSIRLRSRYQVGVNHGRSIGMGYAGNGVRTVQHPTSGEDVEVSASVTKVDEIVRTRTLFLPTDGAVLTADFDFSAVTVMQHFPDPTITVGISS